MVIGGRGIPTNDSIDELNFTGRISGIGKDEFSQSVKKPLMSFL